MGKAEKTRQFIIERTAALFNKKGFAGTALSDLSAATGLTKGAIYGNFNNKEDLALAALEFNTHKLIQQLQIRLGNVTSAKEKLLVWVAFYEEYYDTMVQNGGCAFMNTAVDSDDTHPEIFQSVQKHFHQWRRSIEQTVRQGQKEGSIQKTADANAFADLFIAVVEGSILLSKTLESKQSMRNNLVFLRQWMSSCLFVTYKKSN